MVALSLLFSSWSLLASAAEPVRTAKVTQEKEANEDEGDEEETVEVGREPIDVVVTATRTPESQQRATVRVDLISREEAERRGARNVGEALQGQLGVQVNPSAYGSIGNPAAIQIQGLDQDRVLVLEDGERVIGGVGGAVDLSQLPLTDVRRIEIVTGPTSALYGTQALGGVVNILTGPPRVLGPSGRVRVEGRHPWGALGQAQGYYRHESGLWAGLEASAQYGEGLRLREDVVDLAVPERRQYLAGARLGALDLDGIDLTLRARFIRDETTGLTEEVVPVLGAYRIELPDRVDRIVLQGREIFDLGGGSSLRLSLNRQWVEGVTRKDRVDSPIDEERRRRAVLQSFEAVATIADGDRTYVAGIRAESEDFEQHLFRREILAGEVVESEREEVAPTQLGSGAAYAQIRWDLHETFTVLGGARGELHLRYGGVVAPRLAFAFRPLDWLTLRASGGHGFRAPAARELGFFFDHAALGYRVVGNPDLSPETSWGVNGDIRIAPSDRGSIRAGVYANWIDDLISIDYLASNTAGVDDYTYQNVAKARTFGAQVDARWRATSWLRAEWGYAFTWTRNDSEQRPLVGRPPHTVYGALTGTFPSGTELYVRHRVVTDAFVDEGLRAPGFSMLDARVSQALVDELTIYAGALNLLDVRKDPFRLGDQRPLTGRTFYLGLTATLPST